MSKTLGELLRADKQELNVMALDTTEIKKLSNLVPRDGNIDVGIASNLATRFLRGADTCSDLVSLATLWVGRAKDTKQKTLNYAFLVKSSEDKNIKTDKMRMAFAELDEDYQAACEKYNECYAFLKWITSKQESLIKAHYLCRRILDGNAQHEQAAGWSGSSPDDDGGDWKDDMKDKEW